MYIPNWQTVLASGLALSPFTIKPPQATGEISSGSVLDFAVEKCLDADQNVRCSKPFLVEKSGCYNIEWSTDGTFAHTTAEVKDAASGEMVFYRDTNGEWKPKKGELVYLDFKPKIAGQGNKTVDYKVTTCNDDE